ncbi:MAG: O-antigen ligase family protein [Bacteroidota bacterium]
MKKFIRKYKSVFIQMAMLWVMGMIFTALSNMYLMLVGLVWLQKRKDKEMFILFLLILTLGDSRLDSLQFIKGLRPIILVLLTARTLGLFAGGKIKFDITFLLIVPFCMVALIGAFRSPVLVSSLTRLFSYAFFIFMVLHYLPYLMSRYGKEILLDILRLGMLILGVGLILAVLSPSVTYLVGRYRGLMGNPNGLGIYSTLLYGFTFVIREFYPEEKKVTNWAFALILASILISQSRTALGAIGIFTFIYLFHRNGFPGILLLWVIIVPMGLIILRYFSLEGIVQGVGLEEYLRVESLTTGTGRFLAWSVGLYYINENPWIGKGFAYEVYVFKQLSENFIATEHQGGMHNSYLTFLMNNGFLGLGFYLIFLIGQFLRMRRMGITFPFIFMALLSATFESWLTSSLNAFTIMFFLVVIVMIHLKPKSNTLIA